MQVAFNAGRPGGEWHPQASATSTAREASAVGEMSAPSHTVEQSREVLVSVFRPIHSMDAPFYYSHLSHTTHQRLQVASFLPRERSACFSPLCSVDEACRPSNQLARRHDTLPLPSHSTDVRNIPGLARCLPTMRDTHPRWLLNAITTLITRGSRGFGLQITASASSQFNSAWHSPR
jgi:hypothetical protein